MKTLALVCMVLMPLIEASHLLHGFPVYDPTKYQCKKVDGGFTEWSCFGPCSVTCGKGYQKRTRHCAAPVPKYGGKKCDGDAVEARKCDTKLKCPIDGGWGPYVKEGVCSKSCGGGEITFRRKCNNPKPQHCGRHCVGKDVRIKDCNTHDCPKWGPWTCGKCKTYKTGKCLKLCTRKCNYHKNDKKYCQGPSSKHTVCNSKYCPDIPPIGHCATCYQNAVSAVGKPDGWVGHNCRATHLADFCKKAKKNNNLSATGGFPANHWFWIHCSADGPWCKPCAVRTLVFNKNCDACEATRNGKCTTAGDEVSNEDVSMVDNETDNMGADNENNNLDIDNATNDLDTADTW